MKIGIHSIEYYLPEHILENMTLAALYPEWTAEKILSKTGIRSRHIASESECVSDITEKAAKKLFSAHNIDSSDIDFLILITENPDYILPPTSCILQDRLGLSVKSGAIDVNLGCSGFVYGLKLAKALIASGESKNLLLLTGDMYSKRINPMDKSTRTLFGDAATASLITTGEDVSEIRSFDIGTNGGGYNHLIIPSGGIRLSKNSETGIVKTEEDGSMRSMDDIYMNGPEIMLFSIEMVPQNVANVLRLHNLTLGDIDWFVFHQANQYILNYLRKKIKIPEEKFIIEMEDVGNTVSSTIPLALKRSYEHGSRFKKGDKIMLVGFGVGLSWGATIIEFGGKL
ncbi:3-oxoacyl-ACP synthase III family protein [Cloacibacillus evryensis]|uniref:Ketoacyl-ACP synthase III n=1 Tax=Cloacibacillus evryensis TaxID=508460 RepID=A0AAW5K684_9BACT|nr:beta-ketoacyl-ACP synthase 3 [Cloacibacillus evryensis]MCQ4814654.1 ketoacyl-ACP synthase III [Cloacibacillus evryensis]